MENWIIKCFHPVNSCIVINPSNTEWCVYQPDILGHLYCIKAVLSHKTTTQFLLHLPGQSWSLYEKQARASSDSQCSHSAHLHTSEPYSTLHKLRLHMHHTQEKHSPYFSMQIPLKSLTVTCTHTLCTHTLTHARFAGGVTSCRDRTTNTSLSLCGFAEPECTALPSQADVPPPPRSHKYPPWVLYGPILFSPTQSQRCHGHVLLSL